MVERMSELKVFGFVLDTKLSFESHIRPIVASASSKLGILRKALCLLSDPVLVTRCFWNFLISVLDDCYPVWMSAAASYLSLLHRVV